MILFNVHTKIKDDLILTLPTLWSGTGLQRQTQELLPPLRLRVNEDTRLLSHRTDIDEIHVTNKTRSLAGYTSYRNTVIVSVFVILTH